MNDISDNSIQSVSRSLAALRELNLHNGASALQLSRGLGLPRATVYRILETLAMEGYVRKDKHTGGYWLEEKVVELGSGFRNQDWILDDAERVIADLYNEFHWCVMLCTPEAESQLIIRVATLKRNLQGGQRSIAGRRVALTSGPGLTYIAFCSDNERTAMLAHLAAHPERDDSHAEDFPVDPEHILARLRVIRDKGYYFHVKTSRARSLSVPVMRGSAAIGVLNMSFFAPNTAQDELIKTYLGKLQRAAQRLGQSAGGIGPAHEVRGEFATKRGRDHRRPIVRGVIDDRSAIHH